MTRRALMSGDRIRISKSGHVARVTLARADKKNALDLPMFEALAAAPADLARDPGIRAVIIHGAGAAFSAGLDVGAFAGGPDAIGRLLQKGSGEIANLAQRAAWAWRELPVPVVAALHGEVFGGGLQVALGADMRVAAPDARLSIMEVRWGLVPDMAGSRLLSGLVAYDVAMELALTGRIVSGEEARALGLVTRVAEDPLAEAENTAACIARHSPDATRAIKHLFHRAPRLDDREGLDLETRLQVALLEGANQREAAMAGLAGREPEFREPTARLPD